MTILGGNLYTQVSVVPLFLPKTRVKIHRDSVRGVDGLTKPYSTTKRFYLYYDGDDSMFSKFDSVFYELLVYKGSNRAYKPDNSNKEFSHKGFIHPATFDSATKHAGSSTHVGNSDSGDTEWTVVTGKFVKTIADIDASKFFRSVYGGLNLPVKRETTPINYATGYNSIYFKHKGVQNRARSMVMKFRLCGMKANPLGGYDYAYGDTSETVFLYPESIKNSGEISVDAYSQTVAVGDAYYSGFSANFGGLSKFEAL